MSGTITRRPRAESDLVDIWSYIADENEAAADRLLGKIEGVLAMLAQHPLAGRARPELHRELRSFPCGSYVVFYLPQPDGIEVVRVLSGFLDLDQVEFQ